MPPPPLREPPLCCAGTKLWGSFASFSSTLRCLFSCFLAFCFADFTFLRLPGGLGGPGAPPCASRLFGPGP